MEEKKNIVFEEAWPLVEVGISKVKRILFEGSKERLSPEDYINHYTTIYLLCDKKHPGDEKYRLYNKYKETLKSCVIEKTLPSIREKYKSNLIGKTLPSMTEKHNEPLLIEVVNGWATHKELVGELIKFFKYLNRYYIPRNFLPTLEEVGVNCFRDLVYEEVKDMVRTGMTIMIDKQREGKQIDKVLLKRTVDMIAELES